MSQYPTQVYSWSLLLFLSSRAVVANLFGTRRWFHGKQFFYRLGWGAWFGDDSRTLFWCALYFYYYYIVVDNEIIIQLTMKHNQIIRSS